MSTLELELKKVTDQKQDLERKFRVGEDDKASFEKVGVGFNFDAVWHALGIMRDLLLETLSSYFSVTVNFVMSVLYGAAPDLWIKKIPQIV